jgi:hypothetical protein
VEFGLKVEQKLSLKIGYHKIHTLTRRFFTINGNGREWNGRKSRNQYYLHNIAYEKKEENCARNGNGKKTTIFLLICVCTSVNRDRGKPRANVNSGGLDRKHVVVYVYAFWSEQ